MAIFISNDAPDMTHVQRNRMSPNPVPSWRSLLRFRHRRLVFEFRAKSANALGAGARHPAKTGAKKFVLLFTFQAETAGFLIELAKFPGGFHSFGKVLGKGAALASGHTDAMETGNGIPADVALWVE